MKDSNFILGQTYGSSDEIRKSVGRRYEAYDETPEIRYPNKHTEFDRLKLEGCPMV